ncbi:helix-turn-helix domain-containing protein [Fontivita pretiosa]|uniref:helix-turn-helix domain-containing protein n=1 Tax=Fontivita pretiosa TaxID=2989684 RepID=UPI003D169BD2
MEPLGTRLRRQRRRLGFTLDELAARTGISKPYLSLIETGRVSNPPSDEKLRKLEQALGFAPGELVSQAHLQRTPVDVRVVLQKLMQDRMQATRALRHDSAKATADSPVAAVSACLRGARPSGALLASVPAENNLDEAYLSGVLQELVDRSAGNVETLATNPIPVINRVSAGYPTDFTDLSYPKGVADEFVSCPDLNDRDAFAARVHGDSMRPKYNEGDIVIFSPAATPRSGDDCFVRFDDGHTTFKRVFFEQEAGVEVIRLQPRNEKYRPQTVPAEQISGLYKAVYRYQRIDGD